MARPIWLACAYGRGSVFLQRIITSQFLLKVRQALRDLPHLSDLISHHSPFTHRAAATLTSLLSQGFCTCCCLWLKRFSTSSVCSLGPASNGSPAEKLPNSFTACCRSQNVYLVSFFTASLRLQSPRYLLDVHIPQLKCEPHSCSASWYGRPSWTQPCRKPSVSPETPQNCLKGLESRHKQHGDSDGAFALAWRGAEGHPHKQIPFSMASGQSYTVHTVG